MPHRGTRLSRGKHEFPGTPTIACRYHGWVFDVTNGACVAALTDGPDSPVVGKVRVRTYPVEERKGIVWVWMGKMAPVPLEEDVPPLLLREDTMTVASWRLTYGNWKWHAENPPGHAFMLHRDGNWYLFRQPPARSVGDYTELTAEGVDGEWLHYRASAVSWEEQYPGLGRWPRFRPWRRRDRRQLPGSIRGERSRSSIRLPGVVRVLHNPFPGDVHYEWYVPADEDHYYYFVVECVWPKGLWSRLQWYARYHLYVRPMKRRFNMQDFTMIGDSTEHARRHGDNMPSPLYRPDVGDFAWREYANAHARGEAVEPAGVGRREAARVR